LTWRELRSLIIAALRASDFEPIMKNMNIIQNELERASVLFRKWKGGRDDESILKEKWLTFHDHKWLTFKRPLTSLSICQKSEALRASTFNDLFLTHVLT